MDANSLFKVALLPKLHRSSLNLSHKYKACICFLFNFLKSGSSPADFTAAASKSIIHKPVLCTLRPEGCSADP